MTFYGMSDRAIQRELGGRLKRRRLDRNLSQQHVADLAGLNRTTIGDMERGTSGGVLTLIQILRALDSLDELETMLPEQSPSPLDLARRQGKQRQRASRRTDDDDQGEPSW